MKTLTNFLIDFARNFIADEHGGTLAIAAYSAPATPTGTISVTRGLSSTIGEAVHFAVDDAAGFTLSSGPYTAYSPIDHEVEWKWTITPPSGGGEPTTWDTSSRNITVFRDRTVAYGRQAFFTPLVATGTYTVSVEGRDGYGGVFTDSTTFDVVSWDSLSDPSRTYIIYDGVDLTGAPAHDAANRYTSLGDAYLAADESSLGFTRFAILGGYTSPGGLGQVRGWHDPTTIVVESYGTGRGKVAGRIAQLRTSNAKTVIVYGVDMIGSPAWDMALGDNGGASYGVGLDINDYTGWGTFSYCSFNGYSQCLSNLTGGAGNIWCEEVDFQDKLDYHVYGSTADYRFGFRGCSMSGPADALAGGARGAGSSPLAVNRNQHGNIRLASPCTLIMDGNQLFANNAWNFGSDNWVSHQPNIRFNMSNNSPGGTMLATRNLIEGSGIRGNSNVSSSANNLLVERNIFLSTTQGNSFSCDSLNHTGWTLRNNIYLGSSAARDPGCDPAANSYRIGVTLEGETNLGNSDPLRAYHNTCVDLLAGPYLAANCGIQSNPRAGSTSTFIAEANLTYAPNYDTPLQPDGALVAQTGATVYGTFGSCMGWTNEPWGGGLADAATTAPISWFNDIDGNPVDGSTFSGGSEIHLALKPSGNDTSTDMYRVTLTDLGDGTFTLTNISGSAIPTQTMLIQLDRRHDRVVFPGSASPSTAGQLYAPAAIVSAGSPSLPTPYWDFFGNVRSGAACKGAIHVAA